MLQTALIRRSCRVGPGSLTPSPSQIPDVNLSIHPARVTARRLPPSADALGSSRYDRLAQVNGDDLPPSLHGHYPASSLLLGSAPLSDASVLSASRLSPLVPFPLPSSARFSRSLQEPD